MQLTQAYARPSAANMSSEGMKFSLSAEGHRPGVALQAIVRDSLAYARVMLALHEVVSADLRFQEKDHTAYQEWVQARYLEELEKERGAQLKALPGKREELAKWKKQAEPLEKRARKLEQDLYYNKDYWGALGKYWRWLREKNPALWYLLDPVVSVHPDGVIFEVFSQDESSYGRVTVPMEKLETLGETQFGTTNVDFSQRLADELKRVRDYRPAWLEVGAHGVSLGTSAGAQFEKKIDLPPSWVRGFLQVQSAASMPSVEVTLSAATVAEILFALRERKERGGPRSIRFRLAPNEKPVLIIDPWNIEIRETNHVWQGEGAQEIRIWGRRRLMVIESLLPHAQSVGVKLLGTGMPSYWSVELATHRFDLGLSGWTENDWSSAARFDLLSAINEPSKGDVAQAAKLLEKELKFTPEELANASDLSRANATSALQQLCREGRAMFDIASGAYRWRQLLPIPAPKGEDDKKLTSAKQWIKDNNVKCHAMKRVPEFLQRFADKGIALFEANVKTPGGTFHPTVGLDADGRASFAQCTCSDFKRNKMRQGPCAHILACAALAAKIQSSSAQGEARFKDQTWVFTGALSLFTREQAEKIIEDGGGKAAGSVSKNTTVLVVGERAGSKLKKAQDLGIKVLTEQQFQDFLEGKTSV